MKVRRAQGSSQGVPDPLLPWKWVLLALLPASFLQSVRNFLQIFRRSSRADRCRTLRKGMIQYFGFWSHEMKREEKKERKRYFSFTMKILLSSYQGALRIALLFLNSWFLKSGIKMTLLKWPNICFCASSTHRDKSALSSIWGGIILEWGLRVNSPGQKPAYWTWHPGLIARR